MKKVTITTKPSSANVNAHADAWVNDRKLHVEPIKRLTFDVPLGLHRRIKSQCALRSENMADVIRDLLEMHFPEEDREVREGDKTANWPAETIA